MKHSAEPSIAAPMSDRNPKSPDADVNVKPTLHDKFNNKLYMPGRYLNPYGCQRSRFKNTHNVIEKSKNADSSIHVDHLGRAKIPYDTKKGIKCLTSSLTKKDMEKVNTGGFKTVRENNNWVSDNE